MKSKAFASAFLLVALSSSLSAAAEKVTIMYTATAAFASAFVAKDQGFFEKHGVDVTLQLNPNTSLVATAVASGSAEVGITTPTVAFQAVDNGIPLQSFASTNVFPDPSAAGLVVSPTSGITGPKDLAGKKIGVPGIGGLLDVVMLEWVAVNGGDPSKINVVEISLPQTADVLKSGQVDGVAGVDPFLSRAVDLGVGKLVGDFMTVVPPGTVGGIFVTTKAWADAHKDAIRGMQAALDDALVYIKSNQDSARASLAKYTTLPPKVVAGLKWPNLSTHLSPETSLKFWNELAVRQKLINTPIDLKAFIIAYPGE
ncbi:MAG: ABC transporter substrate-binding protein [Roseiarcus sp.]|uniref:ABC transporter substrate-binding protein n=1 Tax=Roseiarcus sp. TaxID=1969460 RepID=UPI003C43B1E8